jgi:hypothetical protein
MGLTTAFIENSPKRDKLGKIATGMVLNELGEYEVSPGLKSTCG